MGIFWLSGVDYEPTHNCFGKANLFNSYYTRGLEGFNSNPFNVIVKNSDGSVLAEKQVVLYRENTAGGDFQFKLKEIVKSGLVIGQSYSLEIRDVNDDYLYFTQDINYKYFDLQLAVNVNNYICATTTSAQVFINMPGYVTQTTYALNGVSATASNNSFTLANLQLHQSYSLTVDHPFGCDLPEERRPRSRRLPAI